MKIHMTQSRKVSENAFTILQLERDKEYDLAHTCAANIIKNGWGFAVEPSIMEGMEDLRLQIAYQNYLAATPYPQMEFTEWHKKLSCAQVILKAPNHRQSDKGVQTLIREIL